MPFRIRTFIPLFTVLVACPEADPIDPTDTTGATVDSDSAPTSAPTGSGPDASTGSTSGTSSGSTDDSGSSETSSGSTDDSGSSETSPSSTGPVDACEPGATASCYSGPARTDGVGLCAAGEQICDDRGAWGPCVGEVLPGVEACESPGDENCDGIEDCGALQWYQTFGLGDEEYGVAVAFDGAGNLVLAANGTSSIDFGGGALVSAGGFDMYVARFAPDGKHLWSKRFGDDSDQFRHSSALAIDGAGDIYLAGEFRGLIDFGGGPLVANAMYTPFLVKLNEDGTHVWSQSFLTGDLTFPEAMAFDSVGDLLLGGYFTESLDLGGGALTSAGVADAFVGKFGPDGAHKWSRSFGDTAPQFILALDIDAADKICVGGGFDGTLDLGAGPLTSAGDLDVFVGCLDAKGDALWSRRFGDPDRQLLNDLAIDSQGRLSLGGEMHGAIDFGGDVLGGGAFQGFLAQLDGEGAHVWSRLISEGSTSVLGVKVDPADAVLVTGHYSGSANFGGPTFGSLGFGDVFLVKLDPGGEHVWSTVFGGIDLDQSVGLATSATGAIGITGNFYDSTNLGGAKIPSKGSYDGFVAVFGP
jgi:hypothetical protein